jgi:hypothetical protein
VAAGLVVASLMSKLSGARGESAPIGTQA